MKLNYTFFLVFSICVSCLYGQNNWKSFTKGSGLPIDKAYIMCHDSAGRIWYGTNAGFSSDTGLVYYSNGQFKKVNKSNIGLVYGLHAVKDTVWVNNGELLYSYTDTSWTEYQLDTSTGVTFLWYAGLLVDNAGTKWMKPLDGGLLSFNAGLWKRYTKANSGLKSDNINFMCAQGNAVWFATDSGLMRYDNGQWTHIHKGNSNLQGDTVLLCETDRLGRLWVMVKNKELAMYDGSTFTNHPLTNFDDVLDIEADNNNKIWMVVKSGVMSFNGTTSSFYSIASGIVNEMTLSITVDKLNNKWIGTFEGISIFNENGISLTAQDVASLSAMQLYPNPAKDFVNVDATEKTPYEIYDPVGRLIEKGMITKQGISVAHLPSANYILLLKPDENTVTAGRFVKE